MAFAPFTTKPVREMTAELFCEKISKVTVEMSFHSLDHLSAAQRGEYENTELIKLSKRMPNKVYEQQNGCFKAYYRFKERYRVIVYSFKRDKAVIVTFMDVKELPRYQL